MKKIISFFTLCLISLTAFADELYKPHRFLEFGFDAGAGISTNALSLNEMFQKELVLDMKKLTGELGETGFNMVDEASSSVFMNLNINEYFRFSFSGGMDSYGQMTLSKSLFELLNSGEIKDESFDASLNQDLFVTAGTAFSTKIDKYRMKIGVNAFAPVFHAQLSDVHAGTSADENGTRAWAKGSLDVYSFDDVNEIQKGKIDFNKLIRGTGFDLDLSTEFPLTEKLQIGIFSHLPVIPGRLKYKSSSTVEADMKLGSFSDLMNGEPGKVDVNNSGFDTTEKTLSIHRPLRLGSELAWRPAGKWLTLRPMAALGIKYPFSDKFQFYPEYSLGAELNLADILGLGISTAYLRQIFVHEVTFMLNTRVLELDAGLSVQSPNFIKSFTGHGIGAKFSVKLGW